MGVRTNVDLTFKVGRNNSLKAGDLAFDGALSQLLDTLDHVSVGTATLVAGESNYVVPFGDVFQARLVYVEASGPFTLTPGGLQATGASVDGAGGTYPTGFVGGEVLALEIDNVTVTVTFTAADQSLSDVINRINSAAALAGISGPGSIPTTIARDNGASQLRLLSPTVGVASEVDIQVATTASVLTALGLTVAVTNGAEAVPGQSPLIVSVPSSSAAGGPDNVKAFALLTLQTSGLTIDNLDSANAITLTYAVAGDLLTAPPTAC